MTADGHAEEEQQLAFAASTSDASHAGGSDASVKQIGAAATTFDGIPVLQLRCRAYICPGRAVAATSGPHHVDVASLQAGNRQRRSASTFVLVKQSDV